MSIGESWGGKPLEGSKPFQDVYPLVVGTLVIITIAADYLTGPAIQFPIFYLLPIGLASWCRGLRWGGVLALTMSMSRLCFSVVRPDVWASPVSVLNALIRLVVFSILVYCIDRLARQHRALQTEVRTLTGLLPICAVCKKIRNDANDWVVLEQYISDRSEASFSHGLCPDCLRQHYPAYVRDIPPMPS